MIPPILTKDGIFHVPPFALKCPYEYEIYGTGTLKSFTVKEILRRVSSLPVRDELRKALRNRKFKLVFCDGTPVCRLRQMAHRTIYVKLLPKTKAFFSKLLDKIFTKST